MKNKLIMKSALIIFFIGFFNVSYGQKTLDIEGLYNLPGSGDPQGGATLGVLKNNKFAVMAFGAAETGTWKMINDTLIEFNFKNSPSNLYTLYGRRDNNLADSSRIFFQEFETSGSFIHVGKSGPGKIRMKRIFNEEASCIAFPNVYTQKSEAGNISFAKQPYEDEQWNIYTFNNEEKCNDFVAIMNYKKDPIPPVYASIQKEGLYFLKEKRVSKKKPFDTDKEAHAFINEIVNSDPDPETLYFTPRYKEVKTQEFKNSGYVYDKEKEAFITTNSDSNDSDFNDVRIVYPFKAIRKISITKRDVEIDTEPIFNFECK